jgi:enoyl-[acyl-carrier protein] reductase III
VALVTGASRGIGRATALRLASEGAAVVVNYRRDEAAADETVRAIERGGGQAIAAQADLEEARSIDAMFETVRARFDRLDHLIANAAATSFRPLLETGARHIERTYSITVTGFLHCVRAAAALMEERRGSIVAVSGFDVVRVLPGHGILGPAKAAMETLVRYLGVELAPRGIRVNGVSPGFVETDSARFYAGPEYETRLRDEWISKTPVGRVGRPEDIASVVAFLCSDDARFVCGQTLVVDGGLTLQ